MVYPQQHVFESPNGAPAQRSTYSSGHGKSGQHGAECLYVSWLLPWADLMIDGCIGSETVPPSPGLLNT
jgi:hypothetical protein